MCVDCDLERAETRSKRRVCVRGCLLREMYDSYKIITYKTNVMILRAFLSVILGLLLVLLFCCRSCNLTHPYAQRE